MDKVTVQIDKLMNVFFNSSNNPLSQEWIAEAKCAFREAIKRKHLRKYVFRLPPPSSGIYKLLELIDTEIEVVSNKVKVKVPFRIEHFPAYFQSQPKYMMTTAYGIAPCILHKESSIG